MKTVQYFSDEYLKQCEKFSVDEILCFLEDFQNLHYSSVTPTFMRSEKKSTLISLKVQTNLLRAFKTKAQLEGVRYQTQIKALMEKWLKE